MWTCCDQPTISSRNGRLIFEDRLDDDLVGPEAIFSRQKPEKDPRPAPQHLNQ